jgi:hypothetical protein
MTITLDSIIRQNTKTEFNEFVYKLIELYSLEEVCVHIYKSKFMNLVLLEKLYHSIVTNKTINTNLVLNNLFIKVVSHNISKEIPENDIIHIIKDINTDLFEDHTCELNYHNFKESTCMFSIYSSFKMCLYHYLNATYVSNPYINNNVYISEYFVRKYLQRSTYKSFKDNIITFSYNTHYLKEEFSENDRYENLNLLLYSDKNKRMKISINNSLLWDNIQRENIDMNYIFLNHFRKQELIIKAKSIAYWGAITKLYNWLSWCYWNPDSPFRKKKLASEWDSYKREYEEY